MSEEMMRTKECWSCKGSGYADGENGTVSDRPCGQCGGSGRLPAEPNAEADAVTESIKAAAEALGMEVMSDEAMTALFDQMQAANREADERAARQGLIFLDEERDMAIIAGWYDAAKEVETMEQFLKLHARLTRVYHHDYGTVVHSTASMALAALHLMNHGPQGGLTGFQMQAVSEQIVAYTGIHEGAPARIIRYELLLHHDAEAHFKRAISVRTWAWAQKSAAELLQQFGETASPDQFAHWRSIVGGTVPWGLEVVDPQFRG